MTAVLVAQLEPDPDVWGAAEPVTGMGRVAGTTSRSKHCWVGAASPLVPVQGQPLHLRGMDRHFPSAISQSDHVHLHPPLSCNARSPSACDGDFSTLICAQLGPSSSVRDTAA